MSIRRMIIRKAVPAPKIESFERFLFIGPHPDDIEIGAGATAARLAAEGKKICFVICTDGRYGDALSGGTRGDALAGLRQQEARKAAAELGVRDIRFLELSDGGFYLQEDLEEKLARLIGEFQPDVIFAPDPDPESECHADHLAVGRAAKKLANFASNSGIMERYGAEAAKVQALALYMTAKTNYYLASRGGREKQLAALFGCHLSQYPPEAAETKSLRTYLMLRSRLFGLRVSASGGAEGFRVLGTTHMHCLPEW